MKSSGIGGQAVLEGVMMRNQGTYAVAVRKPDGEISVKKEETKSVRERFPVFRLPIIRGVVAFVESLVLGMKTLTYSSGLLEEEEEKLAAAVPADGVVAVEDSAASRKETLENIVIVLLSILLAVGFFMLLPFGVSELLRDRVHSETTLALIEGVLRVLLFLGYVVAISFVSDIKRVFMYHGAEHKTINCVENGQELTVENVRKQTRYHRRCGTSYLLVVMFISIIFFLFIHIDNLWLRMLYRILLIPVIAGVSFEFITLAGNSDNRIVSFLSKPGLWLQKLTTREPDDGMIEVAIASVEAVFDWRGYQKTLKTQKRKRKKKRNGENPAGFENMVTAVAEPAGGQSPNKDIENEAEEAVWGRPSEKTEAVPADAEQEINTVKEKNNKTLSQKTASAEKPEKAAMRKRAKKAIAGEAPGNVENEQKRRRACAGKGKEKAAQSGDIAATPGRRPAGNMPDQKAPEAKKKTNPFEPVFGRRGRKSRSQLRRELAEREERYRNRAAERARQMKEQEEREAAHEKAYQAARKRKAERLAATQELPKVSDEPVPAPKVEINDASDDLKSLDHFFDE